MTPVWRIRELQAAALAGLLLLAGVIAPTGTIVETVLFAAAAVVGGATFVPGAVRALVKGRLGVSLLMTIAAVGAILLGEVAEAATLAFLFAIAEGLEGYAVARTRNSLRALLDLVPPTATISSGFSMKGRTARRSASLSRRESASIEQNNGERATLMPAFNASDFPPLTLSTTSKRGSRGVA